MEWNIDLIVCGIGQQPCSMGSQHHESFRTDLGVEGQINHFHSVLRWVHDRT
jgi:hypothetical protein